ncbi:MAG: hypothetical protein IJ447_05675 [Clostridia bacterium]|nr:hypothetical protein [Clostridia bacterium]
MKSKKRGLLIACAVIVALAVTLAIASPFIKDGIGMLIARRYIGQDLKNVDNIVLAADCAEVDGNRNSVAGVKEAVRLGADAVVVDLCFRADGTPVMTDRYEDNEAAQTVEELFREMNGEKYKDVKIYLNIVQLSTLTELNHIAVKYNMVGRTYLIGIDESHYSLVTSDSTIVPFLLKYKITQKDTQAIADGKFSAPECIAKYGAGGLEIDADDVSAEVVTALNDFGIPFIVSGIESTSDFCKVLLNGAGTVYVNDIESCAKVLDNWISAMQQRYSLSVEQSIKNEE